MENNYNDLGYLFTKALDGSITEEQFRILNVQLLKSESAREYYLKYITTYTLLQQIDVSYCTGRPTDDTAFTYDKELWDLLAKAEKEAPEIEILEEKPSHELIQKVVYPPREKRKVSKFGFVFLVMNAAAILFLLLIIRFTSPNSGVEVATLTNTINATWEEPNVDMNIGKRLFSKSNSLWLKEGYAELTFDNNSRVTIEAPAQFEIIADDQIKLNYGQLYAMVPSQAIGFTVVTPNSKIIDLGTEFGVRADLNNQTELHVIKGKTMLISSSNKGTRKTFSVTEGHAKSVDLNNIRDITLQTNVFTRRIYSETNFVWKGQHKIDLVDIVNGGNGFGTGQAGTCIDPATGHSGPYKSMPNRSGEDHYKKNQSYLREAKDFPGIDCVIVPGEKSGPLPITTTGLNIPDFPGVTGHTRWLVQTRTHNEVYPFVLNETTYGVDGHSGLSIHASCGITFDLEQIRKIIPGTELISFETLCGLNDSRLTGYYDPAMTANVYVFLDGVQVFYHEFAHVKDNAVPIKIDLRKENPRFITLVAGSGRDDDKLDWFVFAEPTLSIRPK